ncbi:hypothetical protein [Burkholderia anthina]|uniref:hypothetical protein n=1 Tax=Burkholderia anthina TaxID=179879 RepID=UPI00158CC3D4|nr:hypothetical protein [Burkholderia anthina]
MTTYWDFESRSGYPFDIDLAVLAAALSEKLGLPEEQRARNNLNRVANLKVVGKLPARRVGQLLRLGVRA